MARQSGDQEPGLVRISIKPRPGVHFPTPNYQKIHVGKSEYPDTCREAFSACRIDRSCVVTYRHKVPFDVEGFMTICNYANAGHYRCSPGARRMPNSNQIISISHASSSAWFCFDQLEAALSHLAAPRDGVATHLIV